MAITRDDETDYSKSTMAYPMDSEPKVVFVDADVDYSKSTGAYPMYDDQDVAEAAAAGHGVTVTTDPVSAVSTEAFPTPGPVSTGEPAAVATQRESLGLSADPSGDSDSGAQARPSTIPVAGADGIDRDTDPAGTGAAAELAAAPTEETAVPDTQPAPTAKTVKRAQTKVVKPPVPASGDAQTTATGK